MSSRSRQRADTRCSVSVIWGASVASMVSDGKREPRVVGTRGSEKCIGCGERIRTSRPSGYEPDELPLLHPATTHSRGRTGIGQTAQPSVRPYDLAMNPLVIAVLLGTGLVALLPTRRLAERAHSSWIVLIYLPGVLAPAARGRRRARSAAPGHSAHDPPGDRFRSSRSGPASTGCFGRPPRDVPPPPRNVTPPDV